MMDVNRKPILKFVAVALVILLVSACIELVVFNYHAIRYKDSRVELNSEELVAEASDFMVSEGTMIPTADGASIRFFVPEGYYTKLIIHYEATDNAIFTINMTLKNSAEHVITDNYDYRFNTSVTNIADHISGINLSFPTQGIKISNITVLNKINFNVMRFLFMVTIGALFGFVLFSKKIILAKPEVAFAVIAFSIGALMMILLPFMIPTVWDDDTHFQRIYEQSFFDEVKWSKAFSDFRYMNLPATNTIEEKEAVMTYLNSENDFDNPVLTSQKSPYIPYQYLTYLPQSLMLALARMLDLSYYSSQVLSRMGGLLFYIVCVYFAIRISKIGKRIIAVLALMPTPLLLSVNYSYDPYIISLLFLTFAVFTDEYFEKDRKINLKKTAIFLTATILACLPKAVYIPMILVLLLLPESKFYSKKNMYLFRVGVIAIFLTIMATFVIPSVLSPSAAGDVRGGDTSVSGQIAFILHNPFNYAKLLFFSIWDTLGSHLFGHMTFLAFLGWGPSNANYFALFIMMFAVMTDSVKSDKFKFKWSARLFIFMLVFSIICLIWTAMYISFTPVGLEQINGVQPRYYIPLLVPLLFMLRPTKIETVIKQDILNRIAFSTSILILALSIYDCILKPFNF